MVFPILSLKKVIIKTVREEKIDDTDENLKINSTTTHVKINKILNS